MVARARTFGARDDVDIAVGASPTTVLGEQDRIERAVANLVGNAVKYGGHAGPRGAPGSGLGLSIVARVATAHGGRVVAENGTDGGAVLHLHLPTVDDEAG